jgi:hypothetical protein
MRGRAWLAVLGVCACLAARAEAVQIVLSTAGDATLGGLAFRDGDVVLYDDVALTATLLFNEDAFGASENVDAFYLEAGGDILLSTVAAATLGGLSFRDGDLVRYDRVNDVATLLFDEDLFSNDANVDAFTVLPNGNFVLSTEAGETLGGLTFRDGDLVEYDPVNDVATLFFDEDLFAAGEDIDGVFVLPDGSIVLSTRAAADLGGLGFRDGDLVRYDPVNDIATLFFDEDLFGANENVDAVFVPEPATAALLGAGLALLALHTRRAAAQRAA